MCIYTSLYIYRYIYIYLPIYRYNCYGIHKQKSIIDIPTEIEKETANITLKIITQLQEKRAKEENTATKLHKKKTILYWLKVVRVSILVLHLILRANAFCFSTLRIILDVCWLYMAFIILRYVYSILSLWRVSIINESWILLLAFSASTEVISSGNFYSSIC